MPKSDTKYKDAYGDIWVYIGDNLVKRLRDGCIGGWQNGQGLIES